MHKIRLLKAIGDSKEDEHATTLGYGWACTITQCLGK